MGGGGGDLKGHSWTSVFSFHMPRQTIFCGPLLATNTMSVRRNMNTSKELGKLNMPHLYHWFHPIPEELA